MGLVTSRGQAGGLEFDRCPGRREEETPLPPPPPRPVHPVHPIATPHPPSPPSSLAVRARPRDALIGCRPAVTPPSRRHLSVHFPCDSDIRVRCGDERRMADGVKKKREKFKVHSSV